MRKIVALLLFASLCFTPFATAIAQTRAVSTERIDSEVYWKIRREGTERSQAMRTLHFLTDVYGPRLTGSPNFKAAADWTVKQMNAWGFKNTRLEPWDFGHPGWLNERLSAHIVSPVKDALVCEALAWTPGTNGAVTGRAYQLVLPERQTKEQLAAFFDREREQVRGRIVLVGRHQTVPVTFNPQNKRREDQEVRNQYNPDNPANPAATPTATPTPSPAPAQATPRSPAILSAAQANEQLDQFLLASGVLVRINDAGREHGQIRAFNNRTFDVSKVVPTVVMRNEDYGRISRILAGRTPVELEFNIVNRNYPEGRTSYNVVGEIRGTDKADEVVMLGGHLDSWHAATGATDNAVGCTIMLEAARILHTLGLKPRRTIRVALWSGEEQGLLGSKAYVKEHFGTFENPKPEYFKFNGYFNIDSGTGRIRGANIFGPPEAAGVLRQAFAPFEDLGVAGAIASASRRTGGTDSTSFNEAGLPGIGLAQDPIEYGTHTWHTNLDTYERIVEADVRSAAIVVAAAVYHVAMRDEMLPRFTKERMPAPPPTPRPTPTASPTSSPDPTPR
ncbi:MAG TPA: M20/M25/M40 family metallo-hydrolase [Pyrinomonadaceae bacterium]